MSGLFTIAAQVAASVLMGILMTVLDVPVSIRSITVVYVCSFLAGVVVAVIQTVKEDQQP